MSLVYPENERPKEETLPAKLDCLKCRKPFNSSHRIKERVCKTCKGFADWNDSSPLAPDGDGDAFELSDHDRFY